MVTLQELLNRDRAQARRGPLPPVSKTVSNNPRVGLPTSPPKTSPAPAKTEYRHDPALPNWQNLANEAKQQEGGKTAAAFEDWWESEQSPSRTETKGDGLDRPLAHYVGDAGAAASDTVGDWLATAGGNWRNQLQEDAEAWGSQNTRERLATIMGRTGIIGQIGTSLGKSDSTDKFMRTAIDVVEPEWESWGRALAPAKWDELTGRDIGNIALDAGTLVGIGAPLKLAKPLLKGGLGAGKASKTAKTAAGAADEAVEATGKSTKKLFSKTAKTPEQRAKSVERIKKAGKATAVGGGLTAASVAGVLGLEKLKGGLNGGGDTFNNYYNLPENAPVQVGPDGLLYGYGAGGSDSWAPTTPQEAQAILDAWGSGSGGTYVRHAGG